jgi:putative hydrolase of the HAD superfamily
VPSSQFSSIVFDFGGVVCNPITGKLAEVAGWHGVTMLEMLDVLLGPREVSTPDHPWHRAERGEIPTSAMAAEAVPFAERVGITLRGDEYDYLLNGDFALNDAVVERIGRLRAEGFRVGLLTNSFQEFRPILESRMDFSLFDDVVDSSFVGCRKPEPAIYELTTARFGGDASRIVYLDDFLANVEGARRHGWTTIHVVDPAVAIAELDALLAT